MHVYILALERLVAGKVPDSGERTEVTVGGTPGGSTVNLTQTPSDNFQPVGSGISHLSMQRGRELNLKGQRQNRVQDAISRGTREAVCEFDNY